MSVSVTNIAGEKDRLFKIDGFCPFAITIPTTEIYTHIVDDELEEGMKNFRKGKGNE